ncbi:chaperone NapD [Oceanomicrobium pacificus]|uniref:Chaperone NapD n=1 Tax=Oceanomicrobium pacificus TaxID=2692916 RepID=A0A6B0U725_9RHOB|nr:chaperone NapD [Oceanomicrobium pacificus]MXU66661.1 nitrate reductase formation protein NapD [Oceanomicrobium pacificus]
MTKPVHISSLLITVRPDRLADVCAAIDAEEIAEVALQDPQGKIVVTLETDSEGQIMDALDRIQVLPGVANASLVFHQIDDAPDTELASMTGA